MTEYADKYWLCISCAVKQGAKPNSGVCTVIKGMCGHCKCDNVEVLIPWVDFDWPKDKQKDFSAKIGRD